MPPLDHTSAPEIVALMRDLGSLEKLYSDTMSEMCSLKSTLRLEVKIREAAETSCADLEKGEILSRRDAENDQNGPRFPWPKAWKFSDASKVAHFSDLRT
ncbi:unnamed protein product [Calypogeia fissa]